MSCYALALLTLIRLATKASNPPPREASNDRSATNPCAPYLDSEMWASRESGSPASAFARWGEDSATAPAHLNSTIALPQTSLQLARNTILGTTLGLGLAAFYILPASYQRRYVQIAMAILPEMRIQDNFLFHHTGDVLHDQVLRTVSLVAVILITLTVATLLYLRAREGAPYLDSEMWASREARPSSSHSLEISPLTLSPQREHTKRVPAFVFTSLTILTITIALLLTPLTTPIWNHAPELAFLQFPWRLTAILAAVLSLTIALALSEIKIKPAAATALSITLATAFTYPAYTFFHQPCDDEDTVQTRLTLFQSNKGAEPTDEYTPTTADNDSLAPADPAYWLSPAPHAKAPANTIPSPAPTHLTVNSPAPEDIILNLRDYPSWSITRNGTPITNRLQRDDGLIALPIPAGPSTIDITYAQTMDQTAGDIISLASIAFLALFLSRRRTKSQNKIVSTL
jgi:hypothetical protein